MHETITFYIFFISAQENISVLPFPRWRVCNIVSYTVRYTLCAHRVNNTTLLVLHARLLRATSKERERRKEIFYGPARIRPPMCSIHSHIARNLQQAYVLLNTTRVLTCSMYLGYLEKAVLFIFKLSLGNQESRAG